MRTKAEIDSKIAEIKASISAVDEPQTIEAAVSKIITLLCLERQMRMLMWVLTPSDEPELAGIS